MKITAKWMRSVQGQLTMLGLAFAGAVVLAVAALCLRSVLFERFIGEKYRQPEKEVETLLRALADGSASDAQRKQLSEESADVLYEAWMADDKLDPDGRAARYLLTKRTAVILKRIRRTLAVGDADQRGRVLELLAWAEPPEKATAAALCRHALRTATRRGETPLAERAGAVLAKLE